MTSRTNPGSPAADTKSVAGPSRVDTRAVWDQFRRSVRALLEDQPSSNLVRATAHRMDQYVLAAADAEVKAREEQPEAELH
ncbi:hypothetical protein [Streptomyces sp. NBC_00620]|uniref:hypothetical protein n=1 Tax=Streptomyces sp. NBC_00620 TaxID=2903666 RepID=UPI002250A99F|nr:hypothetical protein [Streptomyces sp. NBC_00620]MCX4972179.1 hypothetical protein [Streptomyces sp. NBC_00620]